MPKKKSYLDIQQFTTKFTPESSYILGLLFADGHINKKTNEIRICCLKEDADIYEPTFQKCGQWNRFNKEKYFKNRNNKPQGILHCSEKQIRDILLTSKDFLLSQIPHELKHYWFRGLIDGDGSWYVGQTSRKLPSGTINTFKIRKFVICSNYQQDWSYFTDLLDIINISHYKISQSSFKTGSHSAVTVTGLENYLKLGNYVYQNYTEDNIGLPRKYNKWKNVIDSYYTNKRG